MNKATYYRKNVYGNTLMYPVNEVAVTLCQIHKSKTASEYLIALSKYIGIEWVEVLESSTL